MLFLIIIPVSHESIITLEQTLDQLALDNVTCLHIGKIAEMYKGQYLILHNKYVIVRIQ